MSFHTKEYKTLRLRNYTNINLQNTKSISAIYTKNQTQRRSRNPHPKNQKLAGYVSLDQAPIIG
jgi:hypothetical protein